MEDGDTNLTEAERRRVRRRQRILENQDSRLDRILGAGSKSSFANEGKGSTGANFTSENDATTTLNAASTSFTNSKGPDSPNSAEATSFYSQAKEKKDPTGLPQLLKELSEDFTGVQSPTIATSGEPKLGVQSDGSVILPKIPHHAGQMLICVLALFLSLLNAKQFAVTFISWEIAYYFLNGLPPYPPPNTVLVALALAGLRESHLQRFKKILHIIDCASVDFSLFLTFVMIPHIVSNVVQIYN